MTATKSKHAVAVGMAHELLERLGLTIAECQEGKVYGDYDLDRIEEYMLFCTSGASFWPTLIIAVHRTLTETVTSVQDMCDMKHLRKLRMRADAMVDKYQAAPRIAEYRDELRAKRIGTCHGFDPDSPGMIKQERAVQS